MHLSVHGCLLQQVLSSLRERKLIDYLAIDFKTSPARYYELHNQPDTAAVLVSCRLAIEIAPEYEFRTTCVPGLVTKKELHEMGRVIKGAQRWVLFRKKLTLQQDLRSCARVLRPTQSRLRAAAGNFVGV